jgi:hypothetical protein
MRTAAICPTCATYTNAVCVIYDGDYLPDIDASPMDSLELILVNIDDAVGSISSTVSTINSQITTINANLALKEDSANKSNGPLGSSSTLFPTENSVKTYVDTQDALNEKVANKVTSQATFISNGTSTIKYPAVKAVKDYVDAVTTGLLQDNGNYDPTITGDYPTSANTLSTGNPMTGDLWYIDTAGTMNGNAVLVGYSVRALIDNPSPTADGDWAISNVGLGFIPEDSANKSDDATFNGGTPSHVEFPTQYAVATYFANNLPSPDLQTVLGNGHTLTNGRNFQGDNAGVGNLGFDVNAFGQAAGYNNTGTNVNGFGVDAAHDNTGGDVNALGISSAQVNSGSDVNALGSAAANGNTGNHVNALGRDAGISNSFSHVTLLGNNAQASGNNQLVFASGSGYNAQFSNTNITADRKYDLPNAAGRLVLSVNGNTPDSSGNVVVSSGGSVNTIKVSLTSADILALNPTTTFELIPAQGPGTLINVLKIWFKYNFVTLEYTGAGSVTIILGGTTLSYPVTQASGFLGNLASVIIRPTMSSLNYTIQDAFIVDQPLGFKTSGIPTLGDSTVDVYITYDVITL